MPLFVSVEWTCVCVCVCEYFSSVVQKSRWSCYPLGKHAYLITSKALFISIIWLSGCRPLFMRSLHVGVCVSIHVFTACVLWLGPNRVLYVYYLIITCVGMRVCVRLKPNENECNTFALVFSTIRRWILFENTHQRYKHTGINTHTCIHT